MVWNGDESIELGLADALGNARSVAKDIIGAEEIVNFTPKERLIDRITHRLGTSLATALESTIGLHAELR